MSADRRAVRNTLLVFGTLAVLALDAVALAVAGGNDVQEPSPRDTVPTPRRIDSSVAGLALR